MDISIAQALYQWAASASWLSNLVVLVVEDGIFLLPLALLTAWFSATASANRRREAIVVGCLAAVLAVVVGLVLERVLHRPRPFVELGLTPLAPHAADSSFPSDHTLVGVALVGPMLWCAPRWGGWLVAWALLIGFARVAAGFHYPSDILGSAVLAFALDALVWIARPPLVARLNLQRWDAGLRGSLPGVRRQ